LKHVRKKETFDVAIFIISLFKFIYDKVKKFFLYEMNERELKIIIFISCKFDTFKINNKWSETFNWENIKFINWF